MKTNMREAGIGIAFAMALAVAGMFGPSVQAAPIQYPGNGHWYEFVGTVVDWQTAMTNAAAATCTTCGSGTLQGYLVTITSAGENDFVFNSIATSPFQFWMAGSDAAVEGVWRWMAGPETGKSFWLGGVGGTSVGTDTGYADWFNGEPNNANFTEQYLQSAGTSSDFGWNDICREATCSDFGTSQWVGYVVEYSTPEPATLIFLALGLAGLSFARRRCC